MRFANKERYDEVIMQYGPYFEILGHIERAGIDWTLLDENVLDSLHTEFQEYAHGQVARECAKIVGRLGATERKLHDANRKLDLLLAK